MVPVKLTKFRSKQDIFILNTTFFFQNNACFFQTQQVSCCFIYFELFAFSKEQLALILSEKQNTQKVAAMVGLARTSNTSNLALLHFMKPPSAPKGTATAI